MKDEYVEIFEEYFGFDLRKRDRRLYKMNAVKIVVAYLVDEGYDDNYIGSVLGRDRTTSIHHRKITDLMVRLDLESINQEVQKLKEYVEDKRTDN